MEYFAVEGLWWLPVEPKRQVPGTLRFDGDGLELVVYGTLRRFEVPEGQVVRVGPLEWRVEPIVHGTARDGRDFTLFDVGGANLMGPWPLDGVREGYRPEMALEGCHTGVDNFAELWCSFDYLDAWAGPPAVAKVVGDGNTVEVRRKSVDIGEATVGGASVRLVSGVEGATGDERVELARWTSFVVAPAEPSTATALIRSYVRPLHDLLMFCLGRPVRLTSLRLLPLDLADPESGAGQAFFAAVQPSAARESTLPEIASTSSPTILTMRRHPMPFDKLLPRWFDLWANRREVVSLLLAPLYAPFMYEEQRFTSTFQSAEALHDLTLGTRDVSKPDHRKRVKDVVDALEAAGFDAPTLEWVSKVLTTRNDKPLSRKIFDLVSTTGLVGQAVLGAAPDFGVTCASARTGRSHGGAEKTLDAIGTYWYGQTLRWVVRTCLLIELTGDVRYAEQRVIEREPFRHAVQEIGKRTPEVPEAPSADAGPPPHGR